MPRIYRIFVLLATLATAALATPSAARAAPLLRLDARLLVDARRVEGLARWTVENTTDAPIETVPITLYANRFATRPSWLIGLTWFRVYPGGFDPGSIELGEVTVSGTPVTFDAKREALRGHPTHIDLPLPRPLPPGASVEIGLRFTTHVPERFGPFGAVGDQITLEGGWYPILSTLASDGPRPDLPPPDAAASVTVSADRGGHLILGGVHRRARSGRPVSLPPRDAVSLWYAPEASTLARTEHDASCDLVYIPPRRGVRSGLRAPGSLDPLTGAPAWPTQPDRGWVDRPGETMRTAIDALRFLSERAPQLLSEHLRLVEAPLRRDLALPGAGVVWVSDRLMRVTPVERILKFHRIALVRALYAALARRWLGPREAAGDRAWVADVVAEHLTRAFVVARYGEREDAFDVLAPGAFLSAVDDVLYAPQMPNMSSFFNVVDDTDPARDRYRLFFGSQPTGRRIYEKLHDRLGRDGLAQLISGYLAAGRGSLRERAEAPPAWFFAQWLGPYPPGNVRLLSVTSERDGQELVHSARIAREGADAPREPVVVRFTLVDGRREDVVWPGDTREGSVSLRSPLALDAVHLDPQGRLVQRLPGCADDLRLDDRTSLDLKVLLQQIFLTLMPTSGTFTAEAEIVFQRRYDVRHRVGIFPFALPGKIGSSVFYRYGFGPRVTANRLGGFLMPSLRVAAVETNEDGGGWRPGVVASLAVGYSDLVTPLDMMRQNTIVAVARYLLSPGAGATLHGLQLGVQGSILRSPHPRHRLGARLRLGTTFGDVANGERFGLGGGGGVRALGPRELLGRHRMSLGLEYRHTWTRRLDVDIADLEWWEGLEGVLFVDAGVAADEWRDLVDVESTAVGVGYGLRFHLSLLGVQPSMLAVDVAWPLPLSDRIRARTGSPVAVHIAFTQAF